MDSPLQNHEGADEWNFVGGYRGSGELLGDLINENALRLLVPAPASHDPGSQDVARRDNKSALLM